MPQRPRRGSSPPGQHRGVQRLHASAHPRPRGRPRARECDGVSQPGRAATAGGRDGIEQRDERARPRAGRAQGAHAGRRLAASEPCAVVLRGRAVGRGAGDRRRGLANETQSGPGQAGTMCAVGSARIHVWRGDLEHAMRLMETFLPRARQHAVIQQVGPALIVAGLITTAVGTSRPGCGVRRGVLRADRRHAGVPPHGDRRRRPSPGRRVPNRSRRPRRPTTTCIPTFRNECESRTAEATLARARGDANAVEVFRHAAELWRAFGHPLEEHLALVAGQPCDPDADASARSASPASSLRLASESVATLSAHPLRWAPDRAVATRSRPDRNRAGRDAAERPCHSAAAAARRKDSTMQSKTAYTSALQLGDDAPDFTAETTEGTFRFHEWLGDGWGVLFSHPKDFTPVCTTELGEVARHQARVRPAQRQGHRPQRRPARVPSPLGRRHRRDAGARAELPDDRRSRPRRQRPLRDDPSERQRHHHGALGVRDRPRQEGQVDDHLPAEHGSQLQRDPPGDRLAAADGEAQSLDTGQLEPGRRRHHRSGSQRRRSRAKFPDGWKTVKPYLRIVAQPD